MKNKRKGFTLVELLIVIVVIGILSAMMMLSSTEAVSSARASAIISDLRNWKTAALAYYVDHMDSIDKKPDTQVASKDVAKYLSNTPAKGYSIEVENNTYKWFAKYDGADVHDSNIINKLNARRSSVGLLNKEKKDEALKVTEAVYLLIR